MGIAIQAVLLLVAAEAYKLVLVGTCRWYKRALQDISQTAHTLKTSPDL